ncbi:MAG TPA: hypothetical protein ENG61_02870 [Candidatus Korarchaeota archaeon]|nr:hypothetical protein [Candidatus Korarchaeota archaeon]
MECEEIRKWFEAYSNDKRHKEWIELEKFVGERIRKKGRCSRVDLIMIGVWKFIGLKSLLNVNRIASKDPQEIERITAEAFTSLMDDEGRVEKLSEIKGVGTALASAILTFYDPQNYGVIDENVWREVFGEEGRRSFSPRDYIRLLDKLREDARRCGMRVRDVERAYFQKGRARRSRGFPKD